MELRVLKYFLMVAREENITRASEILHVTQPTLSRQLMQLEDELGVQLFIRGRHNIQLTEEGLLLRQRAQDMVSIEELIERDFSKDTEYMRGTISLGCCESMGMQQLSKIMVEFSKLYPLVTYQIYSADSDKVKEKLENGTVDVGLLLEPVDITKYHFKRLDSQERWGVLMREDFFLSDKTSIKPEDLVDCSLLLPQRDIVKNELRNWFGKYYEDLNIKVSYNIGYNIAHLVQQGVGIAICLESMSRMQNIKFVPLAGLEATRSVLVWKNHQLFSKVPKTFIEYVEECL